MSHLSWVWEPQMLPLTASCPSYAWKAWISAAAVSWDMLGNKSSWWVGCQSFHGHLPEQFWDDCSD